MAGMDQPTGSAVEDDDRLAGRTGALLAAHVPLSLLLDLADPCGPDSRDVFATEPGSADWLPSPRPTGLG